MNKKIIKALFSYAVSKESIRPQLQGVHFAEDGCVASDTHLLILYKEAKNDHIGKTMLPNGEVIKGKYPDYKRVLPKKSGKPVKVDWKQVYNALKWYKKQPDFNVNDRVCIGGCHLAMPHLLNLLEVYKAAEDLCCINASTKGPELPMILESEQLKSIIMPCTPEDGAVDKLREDCGSVIMSYENFILTFATESNKPKEVVQELAWL